MRTITTAVYKYDELTLKAQQKALEQWRYTHEYSWADEALASMKAFLEHFGTSVNNYSIDWDYPRGSWVAFDVPEMEEEEIKSLLDQLGGFNPENLRGYGDCVLTGFDKDEDLKDGFRIAWEKGERDIEKLLLAGIDSWLKAVGEDYECEKSEEYFRDHAEGNDYEFTEEGKLI